MDRRELLKSIAILTGASVVGAELFLSGCKSNSPTGILSKNMLELLNEIGETIIPATKTPGAKAADVATFMNAIVSDCYTKVEQEAFLKGIKLIDEEANKIYKKSFLDCSNEQRYDLLVSLEKEAKNYNESKPQDSPSHYYTMMKQLTLWGFFSSETGMTETLRHVPVPGKYQGDLPYVKGDKAWAE
jgi:hypothetical protein